MKVVLLALTAYDLYTSSNGDVPELHMSRTTVAGEVFLFSGGLYTSYTQDSTSCRYFAHKPSRIFYSFTCVIHVQTVECQDYRCNYDQP